MKGESSSTTDTPAHTHPAAAAQPSTGQEPPVPARGVVPSVDPPPATEWESFLNPGRRIAQALGHLVYAIGSHGTQHVPARGGALLVANHPSHADALLVTASLPRRVRFLTAEDGSVPWWLRRVTGLLDVLHIPRAATPAARRTALQAATGAVRRGELVCVFGEAHPSRTGQMQPFQEDCAKVLQEVEAPVIPIYIDPVPGGASDLHGETPWGARFRGFRHRATVCFGAPLPPGASVAEIRCAVQELGAQAWRRRVGVMQPLHRSFVRTARCHPFRHAMSDSREPRVSSFNALTRTIYLARRLRPHWEGQEKVGVLLPPSIAGALVNLAALLMGKVPVNLNYTTSAASLAACIRQCGIRTVVTSEAFRTKVNVELPFPPLALERIATAPRFLERLAALVMSVLLPVRALERALGCTRRIGMNDLATVIFSSGSTGEPKGVMLSQFNVAANIAQLNRVFRLTRRDRLLGVLPFFHSFGFTATLCLPATLGLGVAYHPTPLDAAAAGRLVREHALTFLLTTPTFLQLYLNGCDPAALGSLRVVMVGAEKLPARLAAAFEEKFGLRPFEGYGCTECAPAVAVNTHDFRAAGLHQIGAKRGSIGHPLPGVAVRIVDPVTEERMPPGQPGLMLVSGPNVMLGYLDRPDLTARVARQDWYVTGDIAAMDDDGFLHITDRLSRFSKIGGEMVPHLKVEERLHELAGATEMTFVIASVPDERKGERLVVLHRLPDLPLQACLERLAKDDLPNLWKPKPDAFFRIETFPQLGTGKLDLRRIKELARQLAS